MPRDQHGRPLSREAEPKQPKGRPNLKDSEAEPEKDKEGDKDNKSTTRRARQATDPDDMLQNHHDRLKRIEDHLGIAYKADNMKSEAQREKDGKAKKEEASHVSEKGGKEYGHDVDKGGKIYERRRH